jgi:N-acyl-L-homoserine lactone synthetase
MLQFKVVSTNDERREVFNLRYKVYCVEKKLLCANDYANELEFDKWDIASVHFIAKLQGETCATVRLVLNSTLGFPIEELFGIKTPDNKRNEYAEVSRLIINTRAKSSSFLDHLCLIRSLFQYSQDNGITHWYAIMEKRLFVIYRRSQFLWKPIGEEKECFGGLTGPYLVEINTALEHLKNNNKKLFKFMVEKSEIASTNKALQ